MTFQRHRSYAVSSRSTLAVATLCVLAFHAPRPSAESSQSDEKRDERPSLSLRSSVKVTISASEVLFVAVLKGGADNYEEFYCPTIEWDWDDLTKSETTYDCEPYEPSKSEIRRRYSTRHTFQQSGTYEVKVRLKRKDKVLAYARTNVIVRFGGRSGL